jgi:hypothetical protein
MGTRQLQEPVSSLAKYIHVAYDNGSFNQTEIEFKMDEQLNAITKVINETATLLLSIAVISNVPYSFTLSLDISCPLLPYFSTCPLLYSVNNLLPSLSTHTLHQITIISTTPITKIILWYAMISMGSRNGVTGIVAIY